MFSEFLLVVQEFLLTALRSFQSLTKTKRILFALGLLLIIFGYPTARITANVVENALLKKYRLTAYAPSAQPQNLTSQNPLIIDLGENSFAGLAKVTNPNLDLTLRSGKYTFDFLGADGSVVGTSSSSFYLAPGEQTYLVVPKIKAQGAVNAKLTFSDLRFQKKLGLPKVPLQPSQLTLTNSFDPLTLKAEGSFTNLSPYRISVVRIVVLLKNDQGEIIGAIERKEFNVLQNERRAFVLLWPKIYVEQVADTEIYLDTNLADNNNLQVEDPSLNGSGDLNR